MIANKEIPMSEKIKCAKIRDNKMKFQNNNQKNKDKLNNIQ